MFHTKLLLNDAASKVAKQWGKFGNTEQYDTIANIWQCKTKGTSDRMY